jgi:rhamnogalacturonyl hydrolase YesR
MTTSARFRLVLPLIVATFLCVAAVSAGAVPARQDVVSLMRKAADYQLAEQARKEPSNDWIRAAFYTGVMALHETMRQDAAADTRYRDAAVAWGELSNWTPPRDQRHADALCCGQTYLDLYASDKDEKKIAPFRAAVDRMIETPKPGRVDWWWCDALFMAPPAFAKLAKQTGDDKYLRFMDEMWWDATDFLYDREAGLYYRDKKYFPPKTTSNGSKIFWSRGNGWVAAGTVRVLGEMPQNFPSRAKYLELHQRMAAELIKLQGADGLWRSSLLDPDEFPLGETSGTAFFTYALAWGLNNGTLDRDTYLPHVLKGWEALVSKLTPQGRLTHVQRVAAAPQKIDPNDTHEYAVGAFLLAGSELAKLKPQP